MTPVRIGTRGSALALWQARAVSAELVARGTPVEIVTINTAGDRRTSAGADAGKGMFVKDIDDALSRGDIDVAVHSAKDMAAVPPPGLEIAAVLPREDPHDVFVLPPGSAAVRSGARIATSSPRRIAQLRTSLPQATFHDIRGNVDSRLRKLDGGAFDALVLAAAGLRRLGLADRISEVVTVARCVPAPGQGIIAVEVRANDQRTYALVAAMNHHQTRLALAAEQAVVSALGGGCQLPLGVFAEIHGDRLIVRAAAAALAGSPSVRGESSGDPAAAVSIGHTLALDLIARGARTILES